MQQQIKRMLIFSVVFGLLTDKSKNHNMQQIKRDLYTTTCYNQQPGAPYRCHKHRAALTVGGRKSG